MKGSMNTLPIISAILNASSLMVLAQGTIDLANIDKNAGFVAPIFQPDSAYAFGRYGQPSSTVYSGALPTGTTFYEGLPVTSAYDMVLLYSLNNAVTSPSQMSAATIVPFRTAANPTAAPAGGILFAGAIPIPGTTGGTPIAFAIGAFYVTPDIAAAAAQAGATPQSIYAAVWNNLAAGEGDELGFAQIVPNIPLGGEDTAGTPHIEPSTLEGWTSFSLGPGPEPSSLALLGIGGVALFFGRRFTAGLRPVPRSTPPGRRHEEG
jgi:hypothetical protein